jgi:hypothetical protein
MTLDLSAQWWAETLRAGGIDPSHRPRIEERLGQRLKLEGDVDSQSLASARKHIRRLIGTTGDAIEILSRLDQNREFLHHNTVAFVDRLEHPLAHLRTYHSQFVAALNDFAVEKARLSGKSAKGFEHRDRARFIIDLLEIRAEARRVNAPYQASETAVSGKFIKFLERCVRATEPRLGDAELQLKLKGALDIAVKEFCKRRRLLTQRRNLERRLSRSGGGVERRARTAARHHAQRSVHRRRKS